VSGAGITSPNQLGLKGPGHSAPSLSARTGLAGKKKRVAVVVQRYGEAITGGAEAHARMVAERLSAHVELEVLTSCAVDHLTWANELPEGASRDGPVLVHRYPAQARRHMRPFNALSRELFGHANELLSEEHWLAEQGPRLPGLLEALQRRRNDFDAFLFFTALYAPTAHGLPLVADKALLVPTAHDEPPMAFGVYDDAFRLARGLLCNTEEEQAFIHARFEGVQRSRVVGVGIEPLPAHAQAFRDAYGISGPYLLYVGRLEEGKGVGELVRLHQRLVQHFHDAPTLVLIGAGELRGGKKVLKTGRVDEQTKWNALAGALAVVVPSRYESLSLLTLEAFAVGTPVLGNQASAVLVGQLERSLAGAPFELRELESFVAALKVVGDEREVLSARALAYARRYQWETVISAYLEELDRL
jgi:glycosyltransferase involved in cell wall biosynthesis